MLTNFEKLVLQAIIDSEYHSEIAGTEDVINNHVWYIQHCDVKGSMAPEQLPGVVSSLVKKGMIGVMMQKPRKDSICWITQLGWDTLKNEK